MSALLLDATKASTPLRYLRYRTPNRLTLWFRDWRFAVAARVCLLVRMYQRMRYGFSIIFDCTIHDASKRQIIGGMSCAGWMGEDMTQQWNVGTAH